jgi:hypothetical protein
MLKNFARLFAVAAFAAAAVIPITASAAGGGGGGGTGITVSIGSPITLQNRLLVGVPVTITCTGQLPTGFGFGEVDATIEQANGKVVATGFGIVNLSDCPTTPQTFIVQVTPTSTGFSAPIPFHGGPAIAFAGASACDATFYVCIGGSAGPQPVRI